MAHGWSPGPGLVGSRTRVAGGPRPLKPLVLTHHTNTGRVSHCNFEWLLPRGYKRLGTTELLHSRNSNVHSAGWRIGQQLALQRRWDSGDPTAPDDVRTWTHAEFRSATAAGSTGPVWNATITDIDFLDCQDLTQALPNVRHLNLMGNLGTLINAGALNQLSRLRCLGVQDLFGMTEADCLLVSSAPDLQFLGLHSVPAEYAAVMRRVWKAEIPHGTFVEVRSPRKPEWVAENRDNPLRDWDGRENISAVRYRKAVSHYKKARRAVIALLSTPGDERAGLIQIGRDFGEAFNQLDGTRSPFIETVEREELFASLEAAVAAAELELGKEFGTARDHLHEGVNQVRSW